MNNIGKIDWSGVQNIDRRKPERTDIINKIVARQIIRTTQDIEEWQNAVKVAQNTYYPDRRLLTELYEDIDRDAHVTGIINSIKNKVKAKEFYIVDKNNEVADDKINIFEQKWFFDFLDYFIESYFYGYSLVQFGAKESKFIVKDDTFTGIELIPRENVVPEWAMVKKNTYQSTSKKEGMYYNELPYIATTLFMGSEDLGLFDVVAPHAVGKKNLMISCWENAELFGMPFRMGKTDIKNPDTRGKMETMLQNMGRSGWGVFDSDDDVEYVETTRSDVHKVYLEPMKYHNQEMSKAMAGQTMQFEDGSSRSQSEVHERLFNEFINSFLRDSRFLINNKLIPKMAYLKIPIDGYILQWKEEINNDIVNDKVDQITKLSTDYVIDPEFIEEYTGIKVEEQKNGSSEPAATIMNEVQELYKDFI